jgi:hypothetical protein
MVSQGLTSETVPSDGVTDEERATFVIWLMRNHPRMDDAEALRKVAAQFKSTRELLLRSMLAWAEDEDNAKGLGAIGTVHAFAREIGVDLT